jgi:uncharacterized protein (DUF433 family)
MPLSVANPGMGADPSADGVTRTRGVVAMFADGLGAEEILAEHPDLTAEDIHESLLYAAEALRERELPLRHTA